MFDNVPETKNDDQKNTNSRWAFSLAYGESAELVLLDSQDDPPEDQPQYIKSHMMRITAESGKKYNKRVQCPDYKKDLATEDSECPLCSHWASLTKEEKKDVDWTVGYRAKQELPMSFLVRKENEDGEMEEYRTIRFASDLKKDWDDEVSLEQKLIKDAFDAAVKNKIGDDTRGLTFVVSRGSKPKNGPKPAAIGEISIPITGISYTELDDDNPEHKAYTMSEILEQHVVTDPEQIANLMKPFQES